MKEQEDLYNAAMAKLEEALTTKDKEIEDLQGEAAEQHMEGFDTTIT